MPECTYTHRLYEEMADPRREQDAATLAELYGVGYKLAESHPSLYRLWQLRQELQDWYEERTIPEFARITLNRWLCSARQLGMNALDGFCNTLESWQTEIVNFFEHRITSGVNSKIRVLKRIAFGIPNDAHFRLRVIGFCG